MHRGLCRGESAGGGGDGGWRRKTSGKRLRKVRLAVSVYLRVLQEGRAVIAGLWQATAGQWAGIVR